MNVKKEVMSMDANGITAIISSVGFPIAMCLLIFWYLTKQDENHKEEVNKLKEAVDNNTTVLTKLVERLGHHE